MTWKTLGTVTATGLLFLASWAGAAQTQTTSQAGGSAGAAKAESQAAEKPKRHQATGIVVSLHDTELVILKGQGRAKSKWRFVRNAKTTTQGILSRGAKVTVFYHREGDRKIARRIKVWPAAGRPAEKPPPNRNLPTASCKALARPYASRALALRPGAAPFF